MLNELLANANVGDWLKGAGERLQNRLFRRSGWTIPDDTDTGISFGEGAEAGFGYMEMDVVDLRSKPNWKYEIRGGYIEAGVGIGEISKAQGLVNKILKALPKPIKPSSDLVVMPGGSLTQFIMGPNESKHDLDSSDFKNSSWAYVHIGAEITVLAGDVGLMFLINRDKFLSLETALKASLILTLPLVLSDLMVDCKAWAPYYGSSVGLGAGGKAALRLIQTVQLNAATA